DFWKHIKSFEVFGLCTYYKVDETLEHIMLNCHTLGQRQIWALCARLWGHKYRFLNWPQLYWGLLLGCNLVRFQ
ncbi:hypothetical protein K438DRAFT_1459287, partial [Mycena galopus ATCC 62051]